MERLTIECCGDYVPREMCSIDRYGDADDCDTCIEHCGMSEDGTVDCGGCPINRCFNQLGIYENAHEKIEKRIQEIKACSYYPHNFTGKMVDDFEWVLSLFREDESHEHTAHDQ
ncbi:MAG: hypothetical protein K2N41_04490 [Lachnospiraceae bacterium]|nr:hypothetical protein [Lachnospiraceae bacterium]MDE7238952.1 hypothetical protein [Lachnospiraceae bacterium]